MPLARPTLLILAAGLVGLGAGLIAFYGARGPSGNVDAACAGARPVVQRMGPLARGELAAFQVSDAPRPATPVSFKAPDGRDLALADFRGRAVLLNLWATWCAPCRHEMPALDNLQNTLGGPAFEVVAVNIDTRNPERARSWLAETGIRHMAHYADHSAKIFQDLRAAGRAFGMPTTILIDADGCELGMLAGPAEWASADALALVRAALAR